MKIRFSFLVTAAIVMFLGTMTTSCTQSESKPLRLMSYNVKNGLGMDDISNFARTAKVIQDVKPDVVAIQELDSVTNRSKQKDVLLELAKITGMYHMYAPAIDYDGGKYGIGMLSVERPIRYYNIPLPGREEQRTMLVVEFKEYVYCNMHISLTPEDQLLSLPYIRKEVAKFTDKPVFIAGDLNTEPGDPFIQGLQKDFVICSDTTLRTFPADNPNITIDYIAIDKKNAASFTCKSKYVVNEPEASDHRPIVVEMVKNK